MTEERPAKPLGIKAYGSIPHLPGSRMGPGEHTIEVGQSRIAQYKVRDKHDRVYVQEKLDGSCVAVARVNGEIIPLGRAGYRAITSKYKMHIMFHNWVMENYERFDALLGEGERVVGEWLAQAHGTRYDLTGRDPFVAFDIMTGVERVPVRDLSVRLEAVGLTSPYLIASGPTTIEYAMTALGEFGHYGALDPVEGAVWRIERKDKVDFLAKYVRPDKVDGSYLDSVTGDEPVWNYEGGTHADPTAGGDASEN
jgi:hypothetical protein